MPTSSQFWICVAVNSSSRYYLAQRCVLATSRMPRKKARMTLPHEIKIRETRIVTLRVNAEAALTKAQVIGIVSKQKDALSLSDNLLAGTDYGTPLMDDRANRVGTFGEVKVIEIQREI